MRSSVRLWSANAIANTGRVVASFIQSPDTTDLIQATHVDWRTDSLVSAPPAVMRLLEETKGLAADGRSLTATGLRLLGHMQVDIVSATKDSHVSQRFEIDGVLAKGTNSVALKARNRDVNRTVVLKILRPGRLDYSIRAARTLGSLENIPHLIAPIDAFMIEAQSCSNDAVPLFCLVFPYIDAVTLEQFIRNRPPVDPYFFEAFIRQVGGVLEALESRSLRHGDLHAGNILVTSENPGLEFTVIDPSPDLGEASTYSREESDIEWFKSHLASVLLLLQRHLPSLSTQKYLGPRLFSVINRIRDAPSISFRDILRLIDLNPRYKHWLDERAAFISVKFKEPPPLGLLRWEEMSDPAQALDLFEPYPELFRRIRGFGNSLVVGARGSGKSTYLAALAYFPGSKKRLVETADVFGVLFSCRQGEFKQLSSDFLAFDSGTSLDVKHILVLKIVRRVLNLVANAAELGEIVPTTKLQSLHQFIGGYMNAGSIARVSSSPTADLTNLAAGVVRWEEMENYRLFNESKEARRASRRLDEHALYTFCEIVRDTFGQLATTKFYFLFDDAGEPNIPTHAQHVLNDLITSYNSLYCVKLSAERFSYDLLDSSNRTVEETHDFTTFDIASMYAAESGLGQARSNIREYFTNIVRRRLEFWNYPSADITDYLGDQLKPGSEMISIRDLVGRLAANRKDAYYSGWEVVWQLADKTARNLIELVSEIFAHARIRPPGPGQVGNTLLPQIIAPRFQNRAIRAVSDRRLRGLEFIPGQISVKGNHVPLGKHLYNSASYFGAVCHRYLTEYKRRAGSSRFDERLAIERNDSALLSKEAQSVLKLLVRYGLFDDSNLNVAYDDGQRKPVYVFNRIFCPAFAISFRRDAHIRLSSRKFEEFLLEPAKFAKQGTAFLRNSPVIDGGRMLWDE